MKTNRFRSSVLPVVVMGLSVPFLFQCEALPIPGVPGALGACPDVSSLSAIAKVDFAKEFGVSVDNAAKIKGALNAAVDLRALHSEIDAELKVACGKLAKDLGVVPERNDTVSVCEAAAKAIADTKAKAGGTFTLKIVPPKCGASMSAMADCAASCDASITPGSAKVSCEGGQLSGSCGAQCTGSCDLSAGGSCGGSCDGACSAGFEGTCDGQCDGKCDGKDFKGQCEGKCSGKCDSGAKGQCGGKCSGNCELNSGGKCDGTCTGSCSVDFVAPSCTGEVKPPAMSADCDAQCNAKVSAKLVCTPARVTLVAKGSVDAQAAQRLKSAVEANLPAVLKVSIGMKDKAIRAAGAVKGVVQGVQGSLSAIASGPSAAGKLTLCVGSPLKGAFDAAAGIQANVNVSVNVQASASAGGGTKK